MKVIYHEIGRDALYKVWNSSEDNMIIFFHRGNGSLVFQNEIYPIERGGLCYISAGKQHYTMPLNLFEYDRSKIYISDQKMKGLISALSPRSPMAKLFSESSVIYSLLPEELFEKAEQAFRSAYERSGGELCEEGGLLSFLELMVLISEHKAYGIKSPEGFMARVVEYINSAYTQDMSLDFLSKKFNISKSHFSRMFKLEVGVTLSEYILMTRIAAAKSLLISTDISIGEIAMKCGFSSVSYFCQTFSARVGMTANRYRKLG